MNFLGQGFQQLEHYRQTDTRTDVSENNTVPQLWTVESSKVWRGNVEPIKSAVLAIRLYRDYFVASSLCRRVFNIAPLR